MIFLDCVTLVGSGRKKKTPLLDGVTIKLPSNRRIALLAPHTIKPFSSTSLARKAKKHLVELIEIICGLHPPDAGRVIRESRISFPVGYLGGFDPRLTLRTNIAHLARLYDADENHVLSFLVEAVGLKKFLNLPFSQLPPDLKANLAAIMTYALPFDVYVLTTEIAYKRNVEPRSLPFELFKERSRTCGMIVPVSNEEFALDYFDMAVLSYEGGLFGFDDVGYALREARACAKP